MHITKPLIILLFSVLTLAISAQTVVIKKSDIIESRNGKSYYVHTVQKGQTVYSISRAYEVTPDEIYFENPGTKQAINVNQTILIPTVNKETELKKEVSTSNFDFFYHVAANNETFDQISAIYLIPAKYIRKANPKLTPPFREGEYVKVPVEEAFNVLDGKVNEPVLAETNIEIYKPATRPPAKKPTVSPTNNSNQQNNKQSNTNKPKNTPKPDYKPTKPASETVSFDPSIPVIQDYRHVVILGETTQSIAKKYDISVELLKAANPGLGNTVVKGDRLRIPDKTKLEQQVVKDTSKQIPVEIAEIVEVVKDTNTPIPEKVPIIENISHKVKKKETLYSIGREYGLTVDEIIAANPGLTSHIKIGQIITVPKKKINNPYIIHEVEKTTKTNKLAKLYRIHTYQIMDFNPEVGSRVYEGDAIKIPVGNKAIIVPVTPEDDIIKTIEGPDNEIEMNPTSDCDFIPNTDRVFRVALMIPLSLEEADSLDLEQFFLAPQPSFKSFRFIKFYEGALIALDSLTKQGANVELFVYDVDKNITKTVKVLADPELKSMDLIIGPFFNNSFNQVALFAGNFKIPIINPLSYRDAVANNYNSVFKVKPTVYSQRPLIETYIDKFAPNSKVFLISQTSYFDADIVTDIKNGILSTIDSQVKISNQELLDLSYAVAERDTLYDNTTPPPPFIFEKTEIYPEIIEANITDSTVINNYLVKINYSVDSLYPLLENASPIRNNLVILYGNKKSFILDVLNRLNESRDTFDIQLVGLPTWERINNLNNIKMNNLNTSYFSSSFIDYELDKNQDFIHEFRTRYNTEPDNYAFSGFDITYYFLSALYYLGDDFNSCIDQFPMELIQGTYNFQRVGNTNNFVNDYWHILQIKRLSKTKINDYLLLPQNEEYFYE